MNNTEINKFAEEQGINRYELVIATAKCARMITDDFILQKELEERVEGRELDKPIPVLVSDEFKDEKPVQSAVDLLTNGEFRIVEGSLPEKEEPDDPGK
ncbi:MAG: hypothetical protein IKI03_08685 [Clostridia bacterium]|nr:hypothetical protein [Clostridia bacterium]